MPRKKKQVSKRVRDRKMQFNRKHPRVKPASVAQKKLYAWLEEMSYNEAAVYFQGTSMAEASWIIDRTLHRKKLERDVIAEKLSLKLEDLTP